jgi:RNA polymerase sigma factor (sigma-70 family)
VTAPSDPDLVAACLAGEAQAWSALVARYADLVFGLARQAGLDPARSQDVVQDVHVALWKSLPRLKSAERLLPWIVTTARREAWRVSRRGRAATARERESSRRETAGGPSPGAGLEALEEEQAVREALAALDERCRRLLRALYFEGGAEAGYDELAERLGIPRGSIGPTRGRCLARLKAEVLARGLTPDGSPDPGVSSAPRSASRSRKDARRDPPA